MPKIKPEELVRKKSALKTVKSVDLGPMDTSGRSFKRKKNSETGQYHAGHEFADLMTSMRRGITEMKASMLENKGVNSSDPDYARSSMNEWARRTHNVLQGHAGAEEYVDQATRSIYDNWRAPGSARSSSEQDTKASETLSALEEVSSRRKETGVKVYDQSTKLSPSRARRKHGTDYKGKTVDAYGNFAYRINPTESRPKAPSGKMSRLSLNMEMDDAPQMAKRMAHVVETEPDLVRQSKMMGPKNIGSRVDDAVVYLGQEPNIQNAKRVDRALSHGMGMPHFDTAPPGMESLSPLSSYAEYMPGTSSSHGSNRGEMVKDVVQQKLRGSSKGTHELMGTALESAGYHPGKPSRILSDTDKHLRTQLAARRRAINPDD